ncbi:MAG: sigma 54-interacting transcriptional regulator [Planctomycetes bacterium]|nr:sigma 54-interacting transcriptional regulator [Planctomycetota bacterium]
MFLGEISEIPLDLQAKLLRVLQEGMVTPVGLTRSYPIDVRILCAVKAGK